VKAGTSALPAADPEAPATLADATKVVLWGLVFWGGEQLAASVFERNATAMAAAQAAVAEWGASRMGIAWTEPGDAGGRAARSVLAQRVAVGAAIGLACAVAVVCASVASRAAVVVPGDPSLGVLVVGLFVAALGAVRDELLLRGVVVRATRLLPVGVTLVACGLAAAAARFGADGRVDGALAIEGLRGAVFGALWVRDRGAWMACAANAVWTWTMGPVTSGGLLDVRFAVARGAGPASIAVVAAVAAVAAAVAIRGARLPVPSVRGT
jgi:hypothetical protein